MRKFKQITNEELIMLVSESKSSSELSRRLGYSGASGTITRLRKKLAELNIDTSHWTGQLWSKGKTCLDDPRIRPTKSLEEIFSIKSNASSTYVRSLVLKKKLLDYRCQICFMDDVWCGKKLALQLDHIDGNRNDQRLENLRWVCPNCHSQTDTYCSKNIKNKENIKDKEFIEALKTSKTIHEAIRKLNLSGGWHYSRAKKLMSKHDVIVGELIEQQCKSVAKYIKAPVKTCIDCGKEFQSINERCVGCIGRRCPTKISWPSKEELARLVWKQPCSSLSKLLGVSDSVITKRCRRLGISKPPRGYWAKKKAA